jgi:glycosyltransferase involved in cell wall biosynthesis
MLSIITPTYNRRHLLDAIYQSLLKQCDKNFVWIIIDDGSTDNTETIVRTWIEEGKINIIYERQENGGVNRARNRGVELVQGEMILYLDSDDYLSDDAVSTVYHHWESIKDNPKIAGILFLTECRTTNKIIGQPFSSDISTNNYINFTYVDKNTGDKTVVHKTEIQRKYPFPHFDGEKFAPEGIMYHRIAKEYDYLCANKILQYKEYLEDGITKNYSESEMPAGLLTYHHERTDEIFPYRIRAQSMRKWIRLKRQVKASWLSIFREAKSFWLCCICIPRALIRFPRRRKHKNK